ncbi:hypothetical protein OIO90_003444 [Microbotryomycetes sp. JL221]|nr:hypothetical protein OIO90_003444 [Microbotryomycetes sp. JL221]
MLGLDTLGDNNNNNNNTTSLYQQHLHQQQHRLSPSLFSPSNTTHGPTTASAPTTTTTTTTGQPTLAFTQQPESSPFAQPTTNLDSTQHSNNNNNNNNNNFSLAMLDLASGQGGLGAGLGLDMTMEPSSEFSGLGLSEFLQSLNEPTYLTTEFGQSDVMTNQLLQSTNDALKLQQQQQQNNDTSTNETKIGAGGNTSRADTSGAPSRADQGTSAPGSPVNELRYPLLFFLRHLKQ